MDMELYSSIFEVKSMKIISHLGFSALDWAIIVHIAFLVR